MIDINFFAYFFVFFAVASIWLFEHKIFALSFTIIAMILGLIADIMSVSSFVVVSIYGVACFLYFKEDLHKISKTLLWFVIFIIGYGLLKHLIPGINNWQLIDNEVISDNAYNYSLWLNIDTALVGIFIFTMGLAPLRRLSDVKHMLLKVAPVAIVAITFILVMALLLGVVTIDAKLPNLWLLWILINVGITCVAEEAFYRFFVMGSFQAALHRWKYGALISLLLSSIIFTLMHAGPINYLATVFVAGLFYGYIYQFTKRIEASIMMHFLVNLIHFFFFTYPMLKIDYGV